MTVSLIHAARIAAFACLCVPCGPTGAAETVTPVLAPLTVDEATADALHWGPSLSPSGRYLALIRWQDKKTYIVVADLQDSTVAPVMHSIPHGIVRWVAWDSDDRLLAAAKFRADSVGRPIPIDDDRRHGIRVVRMVAMDRNGENFVMLFQSNFQALYTINLTHVTDFLRNDPRNIIMPAWHNGSIDLFRVNTYNGGSERIAEGTNRTLAWFTDKDGHPAFRIDENWTGAVAHVYARKGPGDAAADDLRWEKIDTIPLRDERDTSVPDFYPLYFGPEPNSYYVAARRDGADTSGIHLYDFIAKKYLKTLASEPGVDIEGMFFDPGTRAFLGVEYYTDRKVTRMADPKLQAEFAALDRYFGNEVDVHLKDHDDALGTWLLYTTGPRDRGSWHIYQRKEKFVREVARRYPALDTKRLGTTQVLRYRARDGLEITGYLTTPPAAPAGSKPPLIMFPHGGPELRDYYHYDAITQLLATRGYQVFQPNFRGSSGFGKRFADSGKRQWGGAMQDDLTDALTFLVEKGYVARDRACIVGGSYGGYAALAAATLTPDLYRCAVSIAGVADLPTWLKSDKRRFSNDPESWAYMKRQVGDPDDDEAMLEARSPARHAAAVKVPILLIHGDEDGRVPVGQSEKMEKALRKAGKDVRFVKIKDAGHSFGNEEWRKAYPPLLEFLEKHLPPTPPAPVAAR